MLQNACMFEIFALVTAFITVFHLFLYVAFIVFVLMIMAGG